jgi:hypothetical protein
MKILFTTNPTSKAKEKGKVVESKGEKQEKFTKSN